MKLNVVHKYIYCLNMSYAVLVIFSIGTSFVKLKFVICLLKYIFFPVVLKRASAPPPSLIDVLRAHQNCTEQENSVKYLFLAYI